MQWSLTVASDILVLDPADMRDAESLGDRFVVRDGGTLRFISGKGEIIGERELPAGSPTGVALNVGDLQSYGTGVALAYRYDLPDTQLDETRIAAYDEKGGLIGDMHIMTTQGGVPRLACSEGSLVSAFYCDAFATCMAAVSPWDVLAREPVHVDNWCGLDHLVVAGPLRVATLGDGSRPCAAHMNWQVAKGDEGVQTSWLGDAGDGGRNAAASSGDAVLLAWRSSGDGGPLFNIARPTGPVLAAGRPLHEGPWSEYMYSVEDAVAIGRGCFGVFWVEARGDLVDGMRPFELSMRVVNTEAELVSPEFEVPVGSLGIADANSRRVAAFWSGGDELVIIYTKYLTDFVGFGELHMARVILTVEP